MKVSALLFLGLFISFFSGFFAGDRAAYTAFTSQTIGDLKVYLPVIKKPYPLPLPGEPGYCLTPEEANLAALINEYRRSHGLPDVPLSRSLSTVAQWHVRDLQWNNPNSGTDFRGQACNLHSWSDRGYWTPVCYTSDHYYASGMWLKPGEITRGAYTDYGFEIATGASSAQGALNSWKNSPPHNAVILEQDVWSGYRWPAMGIGMYGWYAVVWFSRTVDPLGAIPICD